MHTPTTVPASELRQIAIEEAADVAHGFTFAAWLAVAGREDSTSEYDLRAAWRAGEDPADYRDG